MADLKTRYMGLDLRNPVIVTSSRLTSTLKGVKKCEDAGAGAVVLKSIFEEQIDYDAAKMLEGSDDTVYTDAHDFFANRSRDYYIDEYLDLVEKAKDAVSIPVIASVNCITSGSWLDYAHRFEQAGADGLEINAYIIPSNVYKSGQDIEREYIHLIRSIRSRVNIPLGLKMGQQFSGLANMIKQFDDEKVDALVLFNRFYRNDIDIKTERLVPGKVLSEPEESAIPLRWAALVSHFLKADVCASSGVYDGDTLIKQLLAGADAVGVCSAVLKNGHGVIQEMISTLEAWMDSKGYGRLSDFKGKLSHDDAESQTVWERSQYIKAICGIY
jgi:dihydroorotate dehydrogenase (fumarate)